VVDGGTSTSVETNGRECDVKATRTRGCGVLAGEGQGPGMGSLVGGSGCLFYSSESGRAHAYGLVFSLVATREVKPPYHTFF